ncbi:MAG: hypothetical protein WCQ26_09260 [Pseudanabaena sp. ELA748]
MIAPSTPTKPIAYFPQHQTAIALSPPINPIAYFPQHQTAIALIQLFKKSLD